MNWGSIYEPGMVLQCSYASIAVDKLCSAPTVVRAGLNIHVAMANHKKHNYLHFTSSSSSLTRYSPNLSQLQSTTSPQLACHSVLLPIPTSKETARVQISKWLQGSLKQAHTYTYPVAASIQAEWSLQCTPWQLEFSQNANYNAQNYL